VALTIVGVTPPGFRGHATGLSVDAYVPVGVAIPGLPASSTLDDARSGDLQVIGRLRPTLSTDAAALALGSAATRYLAAAPGLRPDARPDTYAVRVDAFSPVPVVIRDGVAAFLAVLVAISGLLLTMTCVNVASMILSRATERRTEIGVRYALGASRRRIIGQLLTESALLFCIAGVAGAVFAAWVTPLLMLFKPPLPPGFTIDLDLHANWRVPAYAAVVATLSGIVFSIAPALRATRTDLGPMLREHAGDAAPSRTRLRGALVGIQMAATIILLIVSGLFTRALGALDALDPGWNANGVYVTNVDLELNGTPSAVGRVLLPELTRRVSAIPGVRVAALATKLPFSGQSSLGPVIADGAESTNLSADIPAYFNRVSPGYFEAMGIPLLRGRDVGDADDASRPSVAVISAAMAARLWPSGDAVGHRFRAGFPPTQTTFEVVGVAGTSKVKRLNEIPPNAYYIPYRQRYNSAMTLIVRLEPTAPAGTVDAVRKAIGDVAPGLPVEQLRPLRAALDVFFLPQRIAAWVGGVLGALGVLIAAVGAYGVAAIAVAQRRREIGIRLALGARRIDLATLLLRRVMRAPVVGMVTGLGCALGLTWPLRRFLGVVDPLDPVTFSAATLALAGVIALAAWTPATRASRLNPVDVLRRD
jgi:predicted permease